MAVIIKIGTTRKSRSGPVNLMFVENMFITQLSTAQAAAAAIIIIEMQICVFERRFQLHRKAMFVLH
jgi:hypothetical protein